MRKRGKKFRRYLDTQDGMRLAGMRAIARQHPLDESQKTELGMALHASIAAVSSGCATEEAFNSMAQCINTSMVLCERGFGAEHMPVVDAAMVALLRLRKYGQTRGRWVMDGPGLTAIKQGIALHEAHLAAVSAQDALDAMREVKRRIDRGDIFELNQARNEA